MADAPLRRIWLWSGLGILVVLMLAAKLTYDFAWNLNSRRVWFELEDAKTMEDLVPAMTRACGTALTLRYEDGLARPVDLPVLSFLARDMRLGHVLAQVSQLSSHTLTCDGTHIVVGPKAPDTIQRIPLTVRCYDRVVVWWYRLWK